MSRVAVAAFAMTLLHAFVCAAGSVKMPDASKGVINGKIAMIGVPVSIDRHGNMTSLARARGSCRVHLTSTDDETRESIYPCDSWFQPSVGRYLFWLEDDTTISFQSVIYYAGERFRGSGAVFPKPLYPAGSIELAKGTSIPAGATFRFLALDTVKNYRPFDRRIAAQDAMRRVRAPAGRILGGLFDAAGYALALSKPQIVEPGHLLVIRPEKPDQRRATLVAVLNRFDRPPLQKCNGVLIGPAGERIAPSVDLQAYDRIVLAWYDLMSSEAMRFTVSCAEQLRFTRRVPLTGGNIATIRGGLRRESESPNR